MASEAEWQEAYNYLLERLRALRADDVIREIDEAAVMPVRRSPATRERVLLSKMAKHELGQTVLEAPTRRDAFHAALLVLEARLVHLPAILGGLQHHFEEKPLRFLSEYGADPKVEDGENTLVREALQRLPASSELKLAVESLIALYEEDR